MPLAAAQLQPQPPLQTRPQPQQTAGSAQEPAAVMLTQAHLPRLPTATIYIVTSPAKPAVVPPASLPLGRPSQPLLQAQPHVQPQAQPHHGSGIGGARWGHHAPILSLPEQQMPPGTEAFQLQVPSAPAHLQPQQAQATGAAAEGVAGGAAGAKPTAKRRQTRLCWPQYRAVGGVANSSKRECKRLFELLLAGQRAWQRELDEGVMVCVRPDATRKQQRVEPQQLPKQEVAAVPASTAAPAQAQAESAAAATTSLRAVPAQGATGWSPGLGVLLLQGTDRQSAICHVLLSLGFHQLDRVQGHAQAQARMPAGTQLPVPTLLVIARSLLTALQRYADCAPPLLSRCRNAASHRANCYSSSCLKLCKAWQRQCVGMG